MLVDLPDESLVRETISSLGPGAKDFSADDLASWISQMEALCASHNSQLSFASLRTDVTGTCLRTFPKPRNERTTVQGYSALSELHIQQLPNVRGNPKLRLSVEGRPLFILLTVSDSDTTQQTFRLVTEDDNATLQISHRTTRVLATALPFSPGLLLERLRLVQTKIREQREHRTQETGPAQREGQLLVPRRRARPPRQRRHTDASDVAEEGSGWKASSYLIAVGLVAVMTGLLVNYSSDVTVRNYVRTNNELLVRSMGLWANYRLFAMTTEATLRSTEFAEFLYDLESAVGSVPNLTPANLQFAKLLEALKLLMFEHFKLPQKIFRYSGADSNRDVFELASKSHPFLTKILTTFQTLSTSEYESLAWGVVGDTQWFGLSDGDFAELRAIKERVDSKFELVGEVPLETIENVLSGINRTAESATYLTLRALTTRQILAPLIKPPTNHHYTQYWANVLGTTTKEVEKFSLRGMYGLSVQYFIDKAKWEAGGPILFYCGGWENIEEDTRNMVTPQLMAKELKAAVVYAEHRYYGKSLPFTDSFKNAEALKYLQVEQVLADYMALAVFIRNNLAVESKTRVPVIAVGGGYSGILATWLRTKYPDVIDGAWASSAPMRAFHGYAIDVGAFDQSVRDIYTGATDTPNHYNCTMDHFALLSRLSTLWGRHDVCFFMSPVIAGKDESRALLALKRILKSYYNSSGEVSTYCVTPSCPLSDEEVAKRWQACTQLPLWECSQGPPNDFFWPACTKDTFESTRKAQCNAQFGDAFGWDESMFQLDYVSSTQQAAWNAGKDVPDIGNFIFTTPGVGPWWRSMLDGGIRHASKGIYYYLLEGVSANADLYHPMDCDPPNLVATRNQIANILKCWSGQKGDSDCKPDDLERVLPTFKKPDSVLKVLCNQAKEPYSWELQPNPTATPNPTTTPKTQGSSRCVASILTLLFIAIAVVQ